MGPIRCPYCSEDIDPAIYPAHQTDHLEQQRKQGVTASLPPSARPASDALTLQPDRNGVLQQPTLAKEGQDPQEFVVTVVHADSGRVFSPFLVQAKDEAAARKLCQRNYLILQSVEPYLEQAGKPKPRLLPYGPPVSDRDFELDYGSRPADRSTPNSTPYLLAALGWFLCGPLGAVLGWWAGNPSSDQHSSDQ